MEARRSRPQRGARTLDRGPVDYFRLSRPSPLGLGTSEGAGEKPGEPPILQCLGASRVSGPGGDLANRHETFADQLSMLATEPIKLAFDKHGSRRNAPLQQLNERKTYMSYPDWSQLPVEAGWLS